MLFVALYPIWAFNDNNAVGRNKTTQAYRLLTFPAIRSIHLPETLYSLTLVKSYSGLQLMKRGEFVAPTYLMLANVLEISYLKSIIKHIYSKE